MKSYFRTVPVLLFSAAPLSAQTTIDTTTTAAVAVPLDGSAEHGDRLHGIVALGGAYVPSYDGSSHYKASPFGLINLKYRGVEIGVVGTALELNFGGDSHFVFGPVIALSGSRSVSDAVGAVKQLDPIGNSVELGGFAGYRFGGNANGEGRILVSVQATQDAKSSRGFSLEPGISYSAIRRQKMFLTLDLKAKINDAKYMRTNFGITPVEAARSGLAAFRPSGGVSQIGGGATAGYQISDHWGVLARASGGTYLSDAANSPIVKAGSKTFGLFAMGVSYSF